MSVAAEYHCAHPPTGSQEAPPEMLPLNTTVRSPLQVARRHPPKCCR
jgi:hypothetical protein